MWSALQNLRSSHNLCYRGSPVYSFPCNSINRSEPRKSLSTIDRDVSGSHVSNKLNKFSSKKFVANKIIIADLRVKLPCIFTRLSVAIRSETDRRTNGCASGHWSLVQRRQYYAVVSLKGIRCIIAETFMRSNTSDASRTTIVSGDRINGLVPVLCHTLSQLYDRSETDIKR